jgi:hypothetical protein
MRTARILLLGVLLCLILLWMDLGCSPRDFLTRRLAADLISASDTFKEPQLFSLRTGIVSNKEFSAPDYMVLQRRGWLIGSEVKCPAGIDPPPCWDVLLTPLGVETVRPSFRVRLPAMVATMARWRSRSRADELVGISGISKGTNIADVEFTWRWVSINPVGAALYDNGVRYRSTVGFRSYDDGWRVVDESVPSNQTLEDALRNAQPLVP